MTGEYDKGHRLYVTEDGDDGVERLLVFEDNDDAESYALSRCADAKRTVIKSVDLDALVVGMSHLDQEMRVGIVLRGDLTVVQSSEPPLTLPAAPPEVDLSVTAVPDGLFVDDVACCDVDDVSCFDTDDVSCFDTDNDKVLAEGELTGTNDIVDRVWALVYDAGSADAQFCSVIIDGTTTLVCFCDEATAKRYAHMQGGRLLAVQYRMSELLDALHESLQDGVAVGAIDVYLIHTVAEGATDRVPAQTGGGSEQQRAMLDRLFYLGWAE